MTQSPDPILTASLYCQDHLDGAIHGVVAPVLQRLRAELPDHQWMAWWVRYGRGGEHLKVRLHGPVEHRAAAKEALAAAAGAFLAGLPAADPAAERIDRRALPPIDAEDRAPEPYPDRSLVWTEYSRSPVLLGTLFLDEDEFVARLTTCLARAAELSLGAEPGPDGAIPGAARQRTLLKTAIAALAGADFEPGGRTLYLAYHRDWLLRFAAPGKAQEAQLRATFDARVAGMAAAVEQVRAVAAAGWCAEAADEGDTPRDRLRDAVAELCGYLAPRRHDPASIGDPFAAEAAFPAVFKTLHGAANQLGLNMPNEAFLYHLLLAAVADGAVAEPVAAESRGMTAARRAGSEGDGAPVIVRIGGLSLDVVERLAGGLGALLEEGAALEARLAVARAELVERVFAAVPGAPPELRTLLLAIKRDCHNARPLAPRLADARWEAVRALAGETADRVPRLEAEAAAHEVRFAAAHAAELQRERCNLLAPLDDAAFARGLALASPDLADAVRRLRRTPPGEWGRRERKAEIGLLRYVTRAAAKVSPFSTLTPVGVGVLSGDPEVRAIRLADRPWRARSLVRLRSYLVHRLVDLLRAYPPFRDGLRVEMNDSLAEISPERFLLLRPQHYHADLDAGRIRHQRDALVTTELRGPVVTRAAELLAGARTSCGALVATLQAELGEGARAQVERLAGLGVLQLLLPWPAHEPWPEMRLLEHLRTLPAGPALDALVDGLARLVALEEGYASAAEPVRSIRALEALIGELTRSAAALAGLGPDAGGGEPATPYNLGEDVYLRPEAGPALAEVPLASARDALDQARLLVRLGVLFEDRFEFRHALAAFARERWPGRGEVGVVEALHQAGPLWQGYAKFHFAARRAPAGAPVTWNPMELPEVEALHRWRTHVHAGLEGCLRQADGEQRLCPDALRALLAPVPAELTDAESWGAMLMLQPASADGALWVLNAVKEGTGRYGSRYSPLMDDDTRDWYASHLSTRGAFELEGERAELLDVLCVQGSTLNVHHPQTPSLLTTPGDETDLPAHRRVRLRDLRIAFDGPGGLPRLRGRGGERYLAVNLGFAYEAHMPTLLRFLCAFGPSELWGVMPRRARQRQGEVVMSGRTVMGNLVVHRRRWTVPVAKLREALELPGSARAFAAVARLRAEWGVPERVYFNDRLPSRFGMTMEKPQYLDFTSPLFVPLLRAALKDRETLTLTEPLPTPEMCPADRDGRRWAVELVLDSLALRAPQSPALAAVPKARRGALVAAAG